MMVIEKEKNPRDLIYEVRIPWDYSNFSILKQCPCCLSSDDLASMELKHESSSVGHRHYWSLQIPYCQSCIEHVEWATGGGGLILFVIAGWFLAIIGMIYISLLPTIHIIIKIISISAIFFLLLFFTAKGDIYCKKIAKAGMKPTCSHYLSSVGHEFLGSDHVFKFRNAQYAKHFAEMNNGKITVTTEEVPVLNKFINRFIKE